MEAASASIVTEAGRLRENVRGRITITVDACDLVTITYFTGSHVEHATMSGANWDTFAKAVANTDRQVKRNRLKADTRLAETRAEYDAIREAAAS